MANLNLSKPDPIRQLIQQQAPGVEVAYSQDDSRFTSSIRLIYKPLSHTFSWDMTAYFGPDVVEVAGRGVMQVIDQMRTDARYALGLGNEIPELEARAHDAGRVEYRKELIEWIEKHRNPIDGDLPTGYADLLDYVRNH